MKLAPVFSFFVFAWAFTVTAPASFAAAAPAPAADSTLEAAVIVIRHGIRSPLVDVEKLNAQTSTTWPAWQTPPGHLTPRGRDLIVKMGSYYRDRFISEGLLTGDDKADAARTYFHANTPQRTVETARALAEGLFPSTSATIHVKQTQGNDRLFVGDPIDDAKKALAIRGRVGDNIPALMSYLSPQIDLLENALGRPGLFGRELSSLGRMASTVDSIMLLYCEGFPMEQVTFGKLTKQQLQDMYKIAETDFDLMVRTPYLARQRMSNLTGHIGATLGSIGRGEPDENALGKPDHRLFYISGHDTTVNSVAALLGLEWVLPNVGRNLCTPGGALVFELRKAGEKRFVRVYFAGQSMDQMRENADISVDKPPVLAPIFVPHGSGAEAGYDVPLEIFEDLVKKSIDPAKILPVETGTPEPSAAAAH